MDEIFGYFPPSANPPSKVPMLTLLKQARAFGLGCVLATQNPVDLDYKGLSNAGTWFIGRLQTERDKMRVADGLESALSNSGGYDRTSYDKLLSQLQQRVFLMRNVHDDAPVLFKSRWALSYLRGPLTSMEISRLMGPKKSEALRGASSPAITPTEMPEQAFPRPALSGDVPEYFLESSSGNESITYKPMVMGLAKLHFIDSKLVLDEWRTLAYLAPLSDEGDKALWIESRVGPDLKLRMDKEPQAGASFAPLPGPAMRAQTYASFGKSLAAHLYENVRSSFWVCETLNVISNPDENERDFRARLAMQSREKRDRAVDELRKKYASKIATLEDRERRASERVEQEKSQLSQQKISTALSVGASILGAFLGRKAISSTNIGRATSAARSAGRIGKESGDVDRAGENLEVVQARRKELQQQFDTDVAAIDRGFDASTVALRRVQVTPRKSDLAIGEIGLVWTPWRRGVDGFPAPAFDLGI
jgi:hypothetical protein